MRMVKKGAGQELWRRPRPTQVCSASKGEDSIPHACYISVSYILLPKQYLQKCTNYKVSHFVIFSIHSNVLFSNLFSNTSIQSVFLRYSDRPSSTAVIQISRNFELEFTSWRLTPRLEEQLITP